MNRFLLYALLLVGGFLAGFVPQYVRSARLQENLRESAARAERAELRDLAAQAYMEAQQKNYGLSAQTVSRYFDRAGSAMGSIQDPSRRQALQEAVGMRDGITALLAKGDPAAIPQLQDLFHKTRTATLP